MVVNTSLNTLILGGNLGFFKDFFEAFFPGWNDCTAYIVNDKKFELILDILQST